MTALAALLRLTHTMMVGGPSVTEHTAEQVNPAMPCGPSVQTMETDEATRDMASRNSPAVAQFNMVRMEFWTCPFPSTSPAKDRTSVCAGIFLSISLPALP